MLVVGIGRSGVGSSVGYMSWVNTRPMVYGSPYGMAYGGQEEPFLRLAAILAPRVATEVPL